LAPPHEDDSFDGLGVEVTGDDPAPGKGADRDPRDVADADRDAAAGRNDDLLDVAAVGEGAEAAHDVLLLAVLDVVPARVRVRAAERGEDLLQRDTVSLELPRIDLDMVLLHEAAERDDVGDAGHLLQVPLHHPVLELAELHRRVPLAGEGVAEDLAG